LLVAQRRACALERVAQPVEKLLLAGIVEIQLAGPGLPEGGLQGIGHGALVSAELALIAELGADHHQVLIGGVVQFVNRDLTRDALAERRADLLHRGLAGPLDRQQGAALEVDAVAQPAFHPDADEAQNSEDHGDTDEPPLLAEKIVIGIFEDFHRN
jgi:hypothetical protein